MQQKVVKRVLTTIPVGVYLLDATARVTVATESREQFLVFTPQSKTKINSATFGQEGWKITYNLGAQKTSGVLTKERKP